MNFENWPISMTKISLKPIFSSSPQTNRIEEEYTSQVTFKTDSIHLRSQEYQSKQYSSFSLKQATAIQNNRWKKSSKEKKTNKQSRSQKTESSPHRRDLWRIRQKRYGNLAHVNNNNNTWIRSKTKTSTGSNRDEISSYILKFIHTEMEIKHQNRLPGVRVKFGFWPCITHK